MARLHGNLRRQQILDADRQFADADAGGVVHGSGDGGGYAGKADFATSQEKWEGLGLPSDLALHLAKLPELRAMLDSKFADGRVITVFAESDKGKTTEFSATVRIDTPQEILYYQHGGILQYVLRQLAGKVPA